MIDIKRVKNLGMTAAMALMVVACEEPVQQEAEVIRPVRTAIVAASKSDGVVDFTGVTKASVETELSFKQGGTITTLNADSGEKLEQGMLIAALDSSDIKLKFDQKNLALHKAQVALETAESNLNRIRSLYENNTVPLGEYESAKERYSNSYATYETEKKGAALMRRELDYYNLYSPVSGIVLESFVSLNENVQAGQIIALVQTGNELVVEVGLPEQFIAKTKVGDNASIEFPSLSDRRYNGEVTEVAYAVKQDTSTYPVTIRINNPAADIRPGMPAKVKMTLLDDGHDAHIIVPLHSIAKDTDGHYSYVVKEVEGRVAVERRNVEIGKIYPEGFEVIQGVVPGEKIVTAGISNLQDGMTVRLLK